MRDINNEIIGLISTCFIVDSKYSSYQDFIEKTESIICRFLELFRNFNGYASMYQMVFIKKNQFDVE